ncbi:MAG: response regulator transcription factor [Chloroflexota bacterium]
MHLLVIEDDPRLGRMLARLLTQDRHVVELATTCRDGRDLAAAGRFDALILDIGLPDGSGLDVARDLRRGGSSLPILVLTARDAVRDRVDGLDAGADDYLVKPFAYQELAARLRALTRRAAAATTQREGGRLVAGPIALDEARRIVEVDGRPVELSARELALLECLLRHPDHVLTRDQLLDHAWPMGAAVTLNSVDAYVSFLRRKLGPEAGERIQTVRGLGYRLVSA